MTQKLNAEPITVSNESDPANNDDTRRAPIPCGLIQARAG
ncbi:hypothetical protein Adu01nite_12120 [Paractinoplanes durhamensis]|uniref:Uncharacterized protein n=1 Tax=Paractinoplanes durhamensis TaxID=113563 RepID=A0ABQ3YQL8_9ACTN|nr:hypothetical protein Adu01nite_12120 [Actinoplanes durhamensis]